MKRKRLPARSAVGRITARTASQRVAPRPYAAIRSFGCTDTSASYSHLAWSADGSVSADPAAGVHLYGYGTACRATISTTFVEVASSVQYTFTGWTGSGSAPAGDSGTARIDAFDFEPLGSTPTASVLASVRNS